MEKKINIGEKEILFKGSAATPIFFKQIFHEDMLTSFFAMQSVNEDNVSGEQVELLEKIAFVMTGEHRNGVTFVDWLDGIEFGDLLEALPNIIDFISDTMQTIEKNNSKNIAAADL